MTEEKIIEILHRYNSFYHGETIWFFSKEEILDFAQALIEVRFAEDAERKHEYISNDAYDCMGREALP
jgi:hypothetical protein